MRHPQWVLVFSAVLPCMSVFGQQINDVNAIGTRDINAGKFQPNVMSVESEVAMGRQLAIEFEQSASLVTDPAISDYANRVAQDIARNSDVKIPITIKILNSPEINAMAFPGGFIYVNTGLITNTENEAQFAGGIAHCIAHVAARHAAGQAGRASFLNLLALPSTIFKGGTSAATLNQNADIPVPAILFSFNRRAEEEADWLGIQYMYKTGYDPQAMVRFFEMMTARDAAKPVSTLFSTHPPNEERAKKSAENISKFLPERQQDLVTTSEFEQVRAALQARQSR